MWNIWGTLWCCITAIHLFACAANLRPLYQRIDANVLRLRPQKRLYGLDQITLLRGITKAMLMPVLAIWYATAMLFPDSLVVIAILCGFVGDVLLLLADRPAYFISGLCAFAVGHVLYMVVLSKPIETPSFWVFLLLIAVYGTLLAVMFRVLGRTLPARMRLPVMLYGALLCCENAFCLLYWQNGNSALCFFGSIFFLISDAVLGMELFQKKHDWGNLAVMSTYLAAQLLLMLGFLRA